MAFVSGPRQVGKTTFAKQLAPLVDQFEYLNWDETEFRRLWTKSPNSLKDRFDFARRNEKRLVVLDEIHKGKGWKQKLKGVYDHLGEDLQILVTGSAKLNVFKKGSDSLMGRYLNFRLHPLSYGELLGDEPADPESWMKGLFKEPKVDLNSSPLKSLLNLSGFPEPYFSGDAKILNIWRRSRVEKIVREDLRDLSRLPELSQVEVLVSLLPTKIGNPLSVQSLREDLEVSHNTVVRWLSYLQELFYFFELRPWTKSVVRTLKKEPKIYLYDWTECENKGVQFENMLAVHLQKACHFWTDTGEGNFQLFYLRNKEKQEIDFLIVRDKQPWLAIEAKMSDTHVDQKAIEKLTGRMNCPFVQVVFQDGIYRKLTETRAMLSAVDFLAKLP